MVVFCWEIFAGFVLPFFLWLVGWFSLARRQRLTPNSWSGYLPRMWEK